MPEPLTFEATSQEPIIAAATALLDKITGSLPRVPWLSNSGQQEAFQKTVQLIANAAEMLDADDNAKYAVTFWTLTLLYADKKSFRLAVASVKNWGSAGLSPVVSFFVNWVGSNMPPAEAVAAIVETRRLTT